MSFCPTPKHDLDELNNDLYDFTRKLRLKYHFRDTQYNDNSIVKLPSNFTPSPYQDEELERMVNKIKHIRIRKKKVKSNLTPELKAALESLLQKVQDGRIVIKSADKGDITVIMSRKFYHNMCMNELSKENFYKHIGIVDPTEKIILTVNSFAVKYKNILTPKEYQYITERKYSMAYFYTMPKLHKSTQISNMLKNSSEYVNLNDFTGIIEGRPIVGGPCFYTSGLSEMVDIILKPIIPLIPHILRDSFDLINRCTKTFSEDATLGSADIKALYTNLTFELVLKAVEYWVTKFTAHIPLLQRFSIAFINEALKIILENNFFCFDDKFVQQIKGFAMGTKAAVQCANLAVAYLEVKMFDLLPTIYPQDFVDFIIRNYFRFLDDIFHAWLKHFDVRQFYDVFESLDENLKFIFSPLSTEVNFLDIAFNITDGQLVMDIYHKPTDAYNYLNYQSCHPSHTRDNIALSLAKRIVQVVSVSADRDRRLDELKCNLESRGHPSKTINFAFSKIMQPKREKSENPIVFTSTYNPGHEFNRKTIVNICQDIHSDSLKKAFSNCTVVMGTRQPKSLRQYLIRSKFSSSLKKVVRNKVGLFKCKKVCKYHRIGYVKPCKSFKFGKSKEFHWIYRRYFDCDSKNAIYILICANCWKFYVGESGDVKKRIRKHKSDVHKIHNSNCKTLSLHLRKCSKLREPFFYIYPLYYVDDRQRRRFIEKRFIQYYNPPLNRDS